MRICALTPPLCFCATVLTLLVWLSPAAPAQAQSIFVGPTPYLEAADIPWGMYQGSTPTALEDFLDCSLDFGITEASGQPLSFPGGGGCTPNSEVDSVDGDDGLVDGNGLGGASWFGDKTMTFTFASPVTAAGIVFTDGAPSTDTYFAAYAPGGAPLGSIGPFVLGDGGFTTAASQDILDAKRCNCNALKAQVISESPHPPACVCRYVPNGRSPLSTDLRLSNPRSHLRIWRSRTLP